MTYDPTDEERARERGWSVEQLQVVQARFGLSNARISELSESERIHLLRKLVLADRPLLRAEHQALFERGDEGAAAPEGKLRALDQLSEARQKVAKARVAGVSCGTVSNPGGLSPPPLQPGAGLSPTGSGWTSLGPGGVGGRTRSIVIHPQQPDRIWLGSVGGGVWHSSNAGANWHPVDDRMANLAVNCMVMDPTDPDTIYAGTGEGFFNIDALRGAGIFRTTDGSTWALLPATATPDFHWVNRLAISPDGSVLLAATRTGIFRSTDPDRQTWTRVHAGDIADLEFHPTDNSRVLAGGGSRHAGLFHSDDGGATWQRATHPAFGNRRAEVTWAAADADTAYASVDDDGGRIFRSTDGGQSYAARGTLNLNLQAAQPLGEQGWYDNVIWAGDPTNVDLVVVGGIDLWRSTDGGNTLRRISDWRRDASAHADHHAIVSHPGYDGVGNRVVFFGNDGGIYRTDDVTTVGNNAERTDGWVNLVNGYAVTQFYGAAGHASTGTVIGGAQDNGTLGFRPAAGVGSWNEILGGDGGYCAADPQDSAIFYEEYVHLDIHRNTNGATDAGEWWKNYISGSFFNELINDWDRKPAPFNIPDAGRRASLFIAPFVVDPNDGNRLLAGGSDLWRTNDAKTPNTSSTGPSWASIKASLGTVPPNRISAVAIAAGDSDQVWVGHEEGELFHTDDATAAAPTWVRVGLGGPNPLTPRRMCTRIVIDAGDHQRIYVTFGGYETGNVWRTNDGGGHWTDISGALPAAPIRCLAIHPRLPHFIYLGSELGVFTSEDSGDTWSPTNEGPTNCSVSDLIWLGETLICATHGRGMFSIDLSGV